MRLPGSLFVLLLLAPASWAAAEETPREFLRALWKEGLTDQALQYIDQLAAREDTPAELQAELDYLRGQSFLARARDADASLKTRRESLSIANSLIADFLTDHPKHPSLALARKDLGEVGVQRGRIAAGEAEATLDPSAASARRTEAREAYTAAQAELSRAQEALADELKALPGVTRRDQLRIAYIEVQMLAAVAQFESAKTHLAGKERNAALQAAADRWHRIYEKYRRRLAGLYALLQQGVCYQEMGRHDKAVELFQDLLAQPDEPEPFRVLRTKTLARCVPCWMAMGKTDIAVQKGREWIGTQRADEKENSDWLQLQLALAQALQTKAEGTEGKTRGQLVQEATTLAKAAAVVPGEHRAQAVRLIADLSPDLPAPMDDDPATFEEALAQARKALRRAQLGKIQQEAIRQRLATGVSAGEKARQDAALIAAATEVFDAYSDARRKLERALGLLLPDTPTADEFQARWYLSFVCYEQQRYTQAIDAAMPILDQAPDDRTAQGAATIVLGARLRLWKAAETTQQRKEHGSAIIALAELVRGTWPESALSETASKAVEKVNATVDALNVEE